MESIMSPNTLPATGFVRLSQIIGNPKSKPPVPALIPVSNSTWWAGVKSGRYPKPIKISTRITAWNVDDIRNFILKNQTSQPDTDMDTNG